MLTQTRRIGVKILTICLLPLLLAILLAGGVFAQEAPVEARLVTGDDSLAVGDPMELTIEVDHPLGYQVFFPELVGEWGDFEVSNQQVQTTADNGDGTATTRQSMDVTLFVPGDFQTPPLVVTASDPNGEVIDVAVAPVSVGVQSVLVDGDTELRDIKPQASLSIRPAWPFVAGGALLGIALFGAGIWLFYRQSRRRVVVDNRLPEEVALDTLGGIASGPLLHEGNYKAYYSAVTDCLRGYIQRQYGIVTADRTTDELTRLLYGSQMTDESATAFGKLFSEADLVKFAEFSPTDDAAVQMLQQARELVEQTAAQQAADRAAETGDGSSSNPPSTGVAAVGA